MPRRSPEAALRPNLRVVQEKSQNQLGLQACHRVRSRLVSRRTATIDQIRAFLIKQGIAVRAGAQALRKSLFAILENCKDEISPRTASLIQGLYEDWCCLDERIETVTGEIVQLSRIEPKCQRLMSVPGIGPLISTALVAAIGTGEAFDAVATWAPGSAWCLDSTAPADVRSWAEFPSAAADSCACYWSRRPGSSCAPAQLVLI
jgi:transposase